jgi:hypothetical protein
MFINMTIIPMLNHYFLVAFEAWRKGNCNLKTKNLEMVFLQASQENIDNS